MIDFFSMKCLSRHEKDILLLEVVLRAEFILSDDLSFSLTSLLSRRYDIRHYRRTDVI